MDTAAIEITSVTKRYGHRYALRDVSLKVFHGEVFGLLGPNGSGKTTLLKILATLVSPTSGTIEEYGFNLKKNGREIRKMVGYLAHESLLYRDLSGEENIRFYSKFYASLLEEKLRERIDTLLGLLKITRWRHEPVKNLSSGLRKRFDIARVMIHDPVLLIFDEPFSNLDLESNVILQNLIGQLRGNKTIILSTHDTEKAKSLCTRVAILKAGNICEIFQSFDVTKPKVTEVLERNDLKIGS